MDKIQIFITHTANSQVGFYSKGKCITNIIGGAAYMNAPLPDTIKDDFILGNTGTNISAKNKSYCELTTQYWAWKNTDYDYYGFCHYRRFFSFSPFHIPEGDWGVIEFPLLNEKSLNEICFDDEHIQNTVPKYDFIIGKGIDTKTLGAKNIREQYSNTPELYVKDYDTMLEVIKEKYPHIYPSAIEYSKGHIFYACNMFIMKKELFHKYCDFLFDILDEFEKQVDISNYSIQSHRVTAHLAERILGIFYLYCKKKFHIKSHELQIALFKNTYGSVTEYFPLKNAVPIVLSCSDEFVPIMCVTINSIIKNSDAKNIYEIIILHCNISDINQKIIKLKYETNSIIISFINISGNVSNFKLSPMYHIGIETYYRFVLLDIIKGCDKVIYLDCDLIVRDDLAKLYDTDVKDYLIAAVKDADISGQINSPNFDTQNYVKRVLRLDNPHDYFQAGVLIFNIPAFRKQYTVNYLLEQASRNIYRYVDQDMLNVLCQGQVKYLDMAWNYIFDNNGVRIKNIVSWAAIDTYEEYINARTNPRIIHYAGDGKPWLNTEAEYANVFWEYARDTPFYEVMLQRMIGNRIKNDNVQKRLDNGSFPSKQSYFSKMTYFFLPKNSSRRERARKWYYSHFGVPQYDEWGNRKKT